MRIEEKKGMLVITTSFYQGKNGCIYLNWGNKPMPLPEQYAETLAYHVPDFDHEAYLKYYYKGKSPC